MSQVVQGVKLQTHLGASAMDEVNDAVKVSLVASSVSSGGAAQADESTFTEATTQFTPVGGVYNDALASDPARGQAAAARITSDRALHVNVRNASGTELGILATPVRVDPTGTTAQPITDNSSSLTVDNNGTFAVQVDGAALTALQLIDDIVKAEDDAHGSGDKGVMSLAVANEGKTSRAADNDYTPLAVNRYGHLFVSAPNMTHASSNGTPITTATDTSLISAPSASNHIRVHRIHAANAGATATWIYWRDGVSGTRLYQVYLPQYGVFSLKLEGAWNLTGGGTPLALYMTTSAAGSVEYTVDYEVVAD